MLSNYGSYLYERLGKSILEDENGFAVYFNVNKACYIEEIYVKPEMRKSGIAAGYADKIAAEAKQKGMEILIGTVKPMSKGATTSMKVLLAYGFEVESCNGELIFFKKSLEA